jgi:hypothetical protein
MNGKQESKGDIGKIFNDGFNGMERIGSKGTHIDTVVMDFVGELVEWFPVHQTMRPIEIGVLQQNHRDNTE